VIRLEYDAGAAALIRALEEAAKAPNEGGTSRHQLRMDRAVIALLRVPAPSAVVPELLRESGVWNPVSRDGLAVYVDGGSQTVMSGQGYLSLLDTTTAIRRLAEREGAPAITEWHVIRELIHSRGQELANMQLYPAVLLRRLEEELDIREPTVAEIARTWCFCDTAFFLEGKYFTKVAWHTVLNLNPVVLVVPPAIMDELDDWRSNAQRPRQQKRARAVVREMDQLTGSHPHGELVGTETAGVELLRIGWEPRNIPEGLTRTLADDRLVASALEHRWRRPGLDVQVLTVDRGPYEKARRLGLQAVYLPEDLRRDSDKKAESAG